MWVATRTCMGIPARTFMSLLVFSTSLTMAAEPPKESACVHVIQKISYWTLPPKTSTLVLGVLSETEDNRRVFGVTDYYTGGHEDIDKFLRQKYLIRRILWAGEVLIENNTESERRGCLVLSINTSGYVTKRIAAAGENAIDQNDPRELENTLQRYRPDLLCSQSQFSYYSMDHAHLDRLFAETHRRVYSDEGMSVRHNFRNLLSVLYGLSHIFNRTQNPASPDELQIIGRLSEKTVRDLLHVMEAHLLYSRLGHQHAQRPERLRTLFDLRAIEQTSDIDHEQLVTLIREVLPRPQASDLEPEVIEINLHEKGPK
jgi:hypothetical protein